MKSYYYIVKAFPSYGSRVFGVYSSAAVGFWVHNEVVVDAIAAKRFVIEHLATEGWCVAKEVSLQLVGEHDYRHDAPGREFFEQSLLDGYTAQFHTRRREVIGDPREAEEMLTAYPQLVRDISSDGATISSDEPRKTPDGDPFQPVWCCGDPGAAWQRSWSRRTYRKVAGSEVRAVLSRMSERDVYCGLIRREALVTFHAESLVRDFAGDAPIQNRTPNGIGESKN